MRILLIHNFYQQFGGEDQVVLQEMERLKKDHEVFFYSRHNDDLLTLSSVQKAKAVFSTISSGTTKSQIAEAVAAFKPDLAFVHNIYPLISPSLYHTLHALRVPIVQVIHDFRPLCTNGWFFNSTGVCEKCKDGNYLHAIRHKCYKDSYVFSTLYATTMSYVRASGALAKVDAFICLTEFAKGKLQSAGVDAARIYVRPNSIDATKVTPSIGSGNYVAFIGRLSPEKGLWTLVRAFEQLNGPVLKIAGTGPLEEPIRKYIEEKQIANIELVGFLSGEQKAEFLHGSMFTVVPSEWYEMFPLVMLEAWAAGKPSISAKLGAMTELVEEGQNGLLFNVGDAADLAKKIDLLYRSPQLVSEMGAKARRLVETRFSLQANDELLTEIFGKVCGVSRQESNDAQQLA